MKTTGESKRIKMIYKEWVEVPKQFRKFILARLTARCLLRR